MIKIIMEESTKNLNLQECYKDIFNVCLGDSYTGLSLVFQYLSCESLRTVAMVCRVWLDIASREKCRRGPCAFMECCKLQNNFAQNNFAWNKILSCIKESSIKPSAGFVFIPITLSANAKERIFHVLSEHCEAIICFLSSLITYNVEIEYPFDTIYAFLPQTPNVKINTLKITEKSLRQNGFDEYVDMISKVSMQNKKCLMLFYTDQTHYIANAMISLARGLDFLVDSKVYWGIQYININNEKENVIPEEKYCLDVNSCVAFLIAGSVDVHMTFIREKSKTEKQIEEDLKLFKNKIKLKKHSVGFEFAYLMDKFYDKTDETRLAMNREIKMKTMVFKKLFPEVPLIGIFENNWLSGTSEKFQKNMYENKIHKLLQETLPTKNFNNRISTMHVIFTYD